MSKAIAFFLGLFILGIIFTGFANSGGGAVATTLVMPLSKTGDTVVVDSTENFLDSDVITIGTEQIYYDSKDDTHFYVDATGRGYNGSKAGAWDAGRVVYNQETSIINEALGTNISAVSANNGWSAVVTIPLDFFRHTVPNMVKMDFPFLQGDMAIIGYLFLACSVGLIISLAMAMLWVAAGIIKLF